LSDSRPLILFATPYFHGPIPIDTTSNEIAARLTTDRARLAEADAVVFHLPDWRSRSLSDMPKYPGQQWVLWSMESSVNYPRLADPAFRRHFDIVIGYEREAEIWTPYMPPIEQWRAVLGAPLPAKTEAAPLVMFQSAPLDRSGRNAFSQAMMNLMPVDSYGRIQQNRKLLADTGRQSKLDTIARYRFCLSLENSRVADYVTEKLYDPLMAGTVPVYRGAPNAAQHAPAHSFIDAEAHAGPEGLMRYLRHLMDTPAEYEAYFDWRSKPLPAWMADKLEAVSRPQWSRLVELIQQRRQLRRDGRPSLPFGLPAALSARTQRMLRRLAGKPARIPEFRQ